MKHILPSLVVLLLSAAPASAKTICTVIADAMSGDVLLEQGDCRSRVTPASTFKIALSLMGFESGFLTGVNAPVLPFKQGYPDWGGSSWTQPTDPTRWMKYSVVWYSQQITSALGVKKLQRYAETFDYGNADFSGDPGKNNALERAWISSSLKIAPLEQVTFLRNLTNRTLPATPQALNLTMAIVETTPASGGWMISGKTGSAYPRLADGSFDRAKGWGWFVGWAEKDGRRLVFTRLNQDEKREKGSAGIRAETAFIKQWPELIAAIP
ncbi:beta-lactamase class D [Hoeflea sp. IMCC20628]|uniref:class D beta-lactamase n=1 Tax=Hoeflea sp. IMCC20628 TaxID=1620421 RepID=UPI00063A8ADD|nr:class D beta-lactamase [Hoeflea sp. IMCC20628]AKI03024.1 beta-lactamase class D [Hoeflea sp. IMCC20628]